MVQLLFADVTDPEQRQKLVAGFLAALDDQKARRSAPVSLPARTPATDQMRGSDDSATADFYRLPALGDGRG